MEEIAISKFKATCLSVLENVRKSGKSVRITKFGKPVAEIVPPQETAESAKSWLGCMRDQIEITGDIVSPLFPPNYNYVAREEQILARYAHLDKVHKPTRKAKPRRAART